ncbi:MAG: response regulator [Mucilaginibacter sp.]|jgi:two-component system response regulator HydG|nr:response regulator [Mucilaginibacter sp.]
MNNKVLIVEDQYIEAKNLKVILQKAGYQVSGIARSANEALKIIEEDYPDLVLLDIYLQGKLTGIDLAKVLRDKNIAFIYLSANSNRQTLDAAKATKPYGFLVKPFREKDVLVMLDIAWYLHRQNQESIIDLKLSTASISRDDFKEIIGTSQGMSEVLNNVKIAGPSNISVLILGESGTGKELIAQCIHRISSRRRESLIIVNCAALPANLIESELFGHEKGAFTGAVDKRIGKFEQANGGTVFLDEIGELPIDLQVKLLRVLQEKEVEPIGGQKKKIDVRIIAATNRNLEDEIATGRFRMDLYYRLNVFPIVLPPLRERKEDILPLARHFVNVYASKENKVITGFTDYVVQTMLNYSWPGNVRELENLMARSVLLASGDMISSLHLPEVKPQGTIAGYNLRVKTITENERDHILSVLETCNWKIFGRGGAAELLELNANTLISRMKKLGIEKKISSKNTID